MAEWIECATCGLEHDARPDELCPRCKAKMSGAGSTSVPTAQRDPPPAPTRARPLSTSDLVPPRPRPAPSSPGVPLSSAPSRGAPWATAERMVARRKLTTAAVVLVVLGASFIWFGMVQRRTARSVADHGKLARAVVEKVVWTEKGVVRKREYNFRAKVHFTTEDGKVVNTDVHVSDDFGKGLRDHKLGSELDVRYLPEDPSSVRLVMDKDDSGFTLAVGGVLLLLGVGVFVWLVVLKSRDSEA
jgi:hypothetical protein